MSASSTIEWTDATWNPVTGCDHVSLGCDNCYAERIATRFGRPFLGAVELHPERLDMPLRWRKPRRVFVNSVSDLFHPEVDYGFIVDVFGYMARAQQHTFQVLTKRPRRMRSIVGDDDGERSFQHAVQRKFENLTSRGDKGGVHADPDSFTWPLPNVWLGTSVENQRYADLRIPYLMATPAAVRFLSVEPLLGPVDLSETVGNSPDWVIVGGESGPGARPIEAEWVRTLRDQCVAASVPFFFKQWGGRTPKANGRQLDGKIWSEYPSLVETQKERMTNG